MIESNRMRFKLEDDSYNVNGEDQWLIIDTETDNHDIVATIPKIGEEEYDDKVMYPFAKMLTASSMMLRALQYIVNCITSPGEDAVLDAEGYNLACTAIAAATVGDDESYPMSPKEEEEFGNAVARDLQIENRGKSLERSFTVVGIYDDNNQPNQPYCDHIKAVSPVQAAREAITASVEGDLRILCVFEGEQMDILRASKADTGYTADNLEELTEQRKQEMKKVSLELAEEQAAWLVNHLHQSEKLEAYLQQQPKMTQRFGFTVDTVDPVLVEIGSLLQAAIAAAAEPDLQFPRLCGNCGSQRVSLLNMNYDFKAERNGKLYDVIITDMEMPTCSICGAQWIGGKEDAIITAATDAAVAAEEAQHESK